MGSVPCTHHLSTLPTPGEVLARLRNNPPLVQCLTNTVVQQFSANVLLALGASPAMDDTAGEAGIFASIASGVLINVGTPHAEESQAMREAVAGAQGAHTPWVLDPVAIGALPVRTKLARELGALSPTVVRGNASEVAALAGAGDGGRGTDSLATPDDVAHAAAGLARATGGAVAVSGATDLITDGERTWRVGGGSVRLTQVTGGGCALGAVVCAIAGVLRPEGRNMTAREAAWAAVCAHALYSVAAERAAEHTKGPGSFAVAFLDHLSLLDPADPALAHTERITSHASSSTEGTRP
ncbi:hydroxyethylthiazole kinase [Galactobacter caseinivorans]|uniref:Hydroxyethylthiazole kinase n=1 Tax=Galactobacter caseinivorans TaxID=2676123 RepID=A0A496PIM7_9MICC|nr:hydroxyethylthiazole kinase [Galactobacter caseinivorans]RKW70308.1 hydroxyethylthiazole kinase [Galactobacter caseinivorans]